MATYTIPTTRATAYLVTASDWNTDIVENIKYFKDSPTFGGSITVTTNATISGALLAANGTAAAPFLALSGATDNGWYRPSAGVWAYVSGSSVERMRIGTSGLMLGSENLAWGSAVSGTQDVILARDAANTLALRNSTNAQTFRVYNTYTDASNFERFSMAWTSNVATIGVGISGTGTARTLQIGATGNNLMNFNISGTNRWQIDGSGHFLAFADNTYDIGASGATRPRTIYAGTSFLAPNGTAAAPSISFANYSSTGFFNGGAATDMEWSVNGVAHGRFNSSGIYILNSDNLVWSNDLSSVKTSLTGADGDNTLAQKNGINAQEFRVYGTTTGGKYALMKHDGTDATISASSGALNLGSSATTRFTISSAGLLAFADNTYTIGASATANRPSSIYAGTSIVNSVTGVGALSMRANSTTSIEVHIRPSSGKSAYIGFTEDTVADRWVIHSKTGSGTLGFATGSSASHTDRVSLTSTGDVAIAATAKLYLDGTAATGNTYIYESAADTMQLVVGGQATQLNTTGLAVYNYPSTGAGANLYSSNGDYIYKSTSSIRYKHDIADLDANAAKAAVMAMRPITYRGKTDEDQRRYVGFIAEEVQEIAPLLCTYDEKGESGTPNYVTYDRVTAYLVSVVQQQQARIDALEARLN